MHLRLDAASAVMAFPFLRGGMGTAFGDRIIALAGVVGGVGGHRADLFA